MSLIELLLIAIGVSMDAFAVSVCKGLSVKSVRFRHILIASLWFGGFQALMPLIGYFAGVYFSDLVHNVDHWLTFLLLGFIGFNMIKESRSCEVEDVNPDFSVKTMFLLAVATSIDALAVGVSFAFLNVNIWMAILLIGLMTAAFSMVGVRVGAVFGCRFKSTAEFFGGVILILIGIKILIEHTLLQ